MFTAGKNQQEFKNKKDWSSYFGPENIWIIHEKNNTNNSIELNRNVALISLNI